MTASPVSGELTYGLERLAMYVLGVDHVMDMPFNDPDSPIPLKYGDIFRQTEEEYSRHNFDRPTPRCCSSISRTPRPNVERLLAFEPEDPTSPGKRISWRIRPMTRRSRPATSSTCWTRAA